MDLGILVLRLAVPFEVGVCSPRKLVVKEVASGSLELRGWQDRSRKESLNRAVLVVVGRR